MATMFLENLKASAADFLRPNYYYVTFSGSFFGEKEFGFLTRSATFPFMTYNTISVQYNNLARHYVNSVDYDPISFEFFVDDGLKVMKFFDSWRKLIMNDGSRTFNYKDEYSGNIEIELINRKRMMRVKCVILDAFPVDIENIALAADANDQLMTLSTSFRYDDVYYEFDEGFSIADVKDNLFDLADGTIGTGVDALKDGIQNLSNKIPTNGMKSIFGGPSASGFSKSQSALAARSKEVFAGGSGGSGTGKITNPIPKSWSPFS
jgi:hypothetical protein